MKTLILLILIQTLLLSRMVYLWAKFMGKFQFSLIRGLMFGYSEATQYFELEKETDKHYQVALGFLVVTLTLTYADEQ